MRTVNHRRRYNEKATALCDRCGTRWYRSDLWRDEEGLLNCPQEGRGRDATSLTKANVASAKAYARSQGHPQRYPGRYDRETAVPIESIFGQIIAEDDSPIVAEDEDIVTGEGP